jgi:hypothetical protein
MRACCHIPACVIASLAGTLVVAGAAGAAAIPACAPVAGDEPPAASFTLQEGQSTELRLGRRQKVDMDLDLTVAGCRFRREEKLDVTERSFRKEGAKLDPDSVEVSASALGDEAVLTVTIERDPETEPGRYTGAAIIEPAATLGQKVRVPLAVTVQYGDMSRLAWVSFIVTFLVGSLVVMLKGLAAGSSHAFGLPPYKPTTVALDLLAAGTGMLAAFGVWKTQYYNNSTWGSSDPFWDGVDLVLVMIAGFIAAATAATIATDPPRRRAA